MGDDPVERCGSCSSILALEVSRFTGLCRLCEHIFPGARKHAWEGDECSRCGLRRGGVIGYYAGYFRERGKRLTPCVTIEDARAFSEAEREPLPHEVVSDV